MIRHAQLEWVESQVAEAVARGATVLAGGDRTDPASNVYQATVLTGPSPDAGILREETFGPVLPLVRVKDAEEALRMANEVPYGLSASVWTRDRARGISVARRLRAGAVCVNDALVHFGIPGLPFGGSGESGFGRSCGLEGLKEMTRSRSFVVDRLGLGREFWWFPYSRAREGTLRGALRFRLRGGLRGLLSGAAQALTEMRRR
jgi:acyl-CoA reductase-like NAD-dependent aldehyde dehydrogenase